MRRLALLMALIGLVALGVGPLSPARVWQTITTSPLVQEVVGGSALSATAHSSTGSQKKSSGKATSGGTSSGQTIHVKGYTKKDGTYVAPYERKAPAPKTSSAASRQPRDAKGRYIRTDSARHDFMKQTGYPNGRPGYVIDHITPLACGGADSPSNMQWQTEEQAKAKDKIERKGCGK